MRNVALRNGKAGSLAVRGMSPFSMQVKIVTISMIIQEKMEIIKQRTDLESHL